MARRKRCPKCGELGRLEHIKLSNGTEFDQYIHHERVDTSTGFVMRFIDQSCTVNIVKPTQDAKK